MKRAIYFDDAKLLARHAYSLGFGMDKSFSGSGQKFFNTFSAPKSTFPPPFFPDSIKYGRSIKPYEARWCYISEVILLAIQMAILKP